MRALRYHISKVSVYFLFCKGCSTPGRICNCDSVNDNWSEDHGLLTDRGQLPVTTLRFGGNDKSNYIIGPLECNGNSKLHI